MQVTSPSAYAGSVEYFDVGRRSRIALAGDVIASMNQYQYHKKGHMRRNGRNQQVGH